MRSIHIHNSMVARTGAAVAGLCVCVLVGQAWAEPAATSEKRSIRYGRDIRPILSDRCFKCHGPDDKARMADLRLDVREAAIAPRKGGAAIVPGNPEASELWKRVTSDHPGMHMPPPDSNKRSLSPEELELVRGWIAAGAVYEPHWAFVPPVRPALPPETGTSKSGNAIDRFIDAALKEEGIAPSDPAPPEVLIRRLFLALTGLPPTLEEMDAFLADQRPDAYERWVDKLLTQEPYRTRYAERMTAPWLDAARYADTCGIHMDAGRQMWLWRDWVIKAFRDNMPYDQFVLEQIAGDLLPNATIEQKIASGFNRNHVTTDEGGAIPEEYLVEYAVDRASTTGSVFLGLTVGCARCHEHKFDPISHEEFYQFYAYFNSIEEPGLYSQLPDPNRAFEPFMLVPSAEQKTQLTSLREKADHLRTLLNIPRFQEDAEREAFVLEAQRRGRLVWEPTTPVSAASVYGATLTIQPDGSVLASGNNPDRDEHLITLRTQGTDLRLLMLEALADKSLGGKVGRAENGNAVLSYVEAEASSITDPSHRTPVRFIWAWADIEQANGDYQVINVLDDWDERGWAVDAISRKGGRVALLLADRPFGYEGGTEVRVRLRYDSIYARHTLGRVRLTLARFDEKGFEQLPAAVSGWYQAGPFPAASPEAAYKTAYGPESETTIVSGKKFGESGPAWQFVANHRDAQTNALPGQGPSAIYLGRRVFCPTPRRIEVSLGSDDGFALFVNGKQVAAREVDRGLAPDQDKVTVELPAGTSTLVLKVVNTGGPAGFYYRAIARADELTGDLVAALVPESARPAELRTRFNEAWRLAHSSEYRRNRDELASTEKQLAELEARIPRTMIMKELPEPRPTYVLVRGVYDKPDKTRPVTRGIPAALGKLPEGAPNNRLGLAQWLIADDNPLVARVAVNRFWEMLFGTGLVRTSQDFGLQGEWPSHPELLDWLAVEFRESGWDVQHMLRLMVTSNAFRRSSMVRPEIREKDPDNRLLAWFPRQRLNAEAIRDQALYVSGLLVEKLGGPSVKPYQPEGLWREVAMLQSNTRIYQRGKGEDLWRRSLYTYWKRACPPPSLMTFDAPTREACTIRRASTNTPLQALVLCNDEQFVEAARVLAARTLQETSGPAGRLAQATENGSSDVAIGSGGGSDAGSGIVPVADRPEGNRPAAGESRERDQERLARMFRRCTGRVPDAAEMQRLIDALGAFRERYREKPADAEKLLQVGEAPLPEGIEAPELAAWTMIANAILNLSATITLS